jgi:hypothetical protein
MRALLAILALVTFPAQAQQRPTEIDPNTKIEGGVNAPVPPPANEKLDEAPKREPMVRPDKVEPKDEKPLSARKPQDEDRERENAPARGETAKPQ